jgi:hypothetical protein
MSVTVGTVVWAKGSSGTDGADVGGYVALASALSGKPGGLVGLNKIHEGTSRDLAMTIADRLTSGRYFVLLCAGSMRPNVAVKPLAAEEISIVVR